VTPEVLLLYYFLKLSHPVHSTAGPQEQRGFEQGVKMGEWGDHLSNGMYLDRILPAILQA
jgi:hypothetical protein